VLATFGRGDLGPNPFAFAVTPRGAYIEVLGVSPLLIDRVPLQGGAPESVLMASNGCPSASPFGSETTVASDGSTLYMISVDFSASCEGASPSVSTYDLATGSLGTIPPPSGTGNLNVNALRATTQRGVYYLTGTEFDPSTGVLVHWDGATSTVIATLPEWSWDLQIVGEKVFVLGAHALYELPLGGGAATNITPVTFGQGAALLAANSTSVFYTLDGTTIVGRNVATGMTITVATPSEPMLSSTATWADDDYFYFGAGSPIDRGLLRVPVGGGLLRVPMGGGEVETFWSAERRIDAVTTVGCKVYWLAATDFPHGKPAELLVGSR